MFIINQILQSSGSNWTPTLAEFILFYLNYLFWTTKLTYFTRNTNFKKVWRHWLGRLWKGVSPAQETTVKGAPILPHPILPHLDFTPPYFTPPYFTPPWFYPTLILPHPWLYPTFYYTPPSTLPHLLQYPTLFYPTLFDQRVCLRQGTVTTCLPKARDGHHTCGSTSNRET